MTDTRSPALQHINQVSPCFCLAKWLQVTIDLVHGTNHSCHHPQRHPIPLSELRDNPQALHNTRYKKEQRKLMLQGKRPPECVYCWDMEDAGSSYSDRMIKSSDDWALPYLAETAALPWDADVIPTYLEVMLDDRCNLSCAYCMADVSSAVFAEMKRHGPYPVSDKGHRMPVHAPVAEPNPYVAAFWKWLPSVLPRLSVLRITGGEPLISPRLTQLLDLLRSANNPGLNLVINSHLSLETRSIERIRQPADELLESGAIGSFDVYTSIDAAGAPAEYLRPGMKYAVVMENIERIAARFEHSKVVVMCAFNLLSLSSMGTLLQDMAELKKRLPNVLLDTAYLRNPHYLSASLATPDLKNLAAKSVLQALETSSGLFNTHEKAKLENALRWMHSEPDSSTIARGRRDFILFASEFDKRKNSALLKVFPEYLPFYRECKKALLATSPG